MPLDNSSNSDNFNVVVEIPSTAISSSNLVNTGSRAYVAGWVIKKIKKLTNNCNLCSSKLSSEIIIDEHFIIQLRCYSQCNLLLPDKHVINLYSYIIQLFNLNFPYFAHKKDSCNNFKNVVSQVVSLEKFTCTDHNLPYIFVNTVCNLLIFSYTNHINRILSKGEKTYMTDPLKLSTQSYFEKYSTKKIALQRNNVNYV